MALVGLTQAASRKFQSRRDPQKGKKGATTFHLGTLDCFMSAYIQDNMAEFSPDVNDLSGLKTTTKIHQNRIEVVRFGLRGWDNFKQPDGGDIIFRTIKKDLMGREYQVVPDELLAEIPGEVIDEMCIAIKKANTVTEKEEKNSGSAS